MRGAGMLSSCPPAAAGASPGMDLPAMTAAASARKDTVLSPAGRPNSLGRNPMAGGPRRRPAQPSVEATATPPDPASRPAPATAARKMLATPSPPPPQPPIAHHRYRA